MIELTRAELILLLQRIKDLEKRDKLKTITFAYLYNSEQSGTVLIPAELYEKDLPNEPN